MENCWDYGSSEEKDGYLVGPFCEADGLPILIHWLLNEAHFSSKSNTIKVARVQKRLVPTMPNSFAEADVQMFIKVTSGRC
jgi:hypothetical protein